MRRRTGVTMTAIAMLGSLLAVAPGQATELLPQAARGIVLPAGFVARPFAQPPIVPTTITWGPDTTGGLASSTASGNLHGAFLYVGGVSGNPLSCDGCGQIWAVSDEGVMHLAADGLNAVLGIAEGPGDTLWVSDNLDSRGRVSELRDTTGDGFFDSRRTVLHNIPNGRHQTNGLTFGPDGMLYVANGNATDNGLECGPPPGPEDPVGLPDPVKGLYENTFRNIECEDPEVLPWTGSILRVDPEWQEVDLLEDIRDDGDACYAEDGMDVESVLVSRGFRNIYDVDFRPGQQGELWTPMNGSDNPASSDPLYAVDVTEEAICGFTEPEEEGQEPEPIFGPVIQDAGFPSCLYDPHWNPFPMPSSGHSHEGDPEPANNLHPGVIEEFGPCDKENVHRPKAVFSEGHEGTSGLAFERGGHFPARYRGDLFVAEWGGLWNANSVPTTIGGAGPTGHKIMHLEIDEDGSVSRQREFMTGALPIDVTFSEDGLMYVADMTGQIYEVRHVADTDPSVTVAMTQGQFVPQAAPLVRGQGVRWVNDDSVVHNVTFQRAVVLVDATAGEQFNLGPDDLQHMNSGDLEPGESYTRTFDTPGVYHYNSTATGTEENTMRGTIVVTTVER